MIASRSFCGISPCIEDTVKFASLIFSVNQSTYVKQDLQVSYKQEDKGRDTKDSTKNFHGM